MNKAAFISIFFLTISCFAGDLPSFKEAYRSEKAELTAEKQSLETLLEKFTDQNKYAENNLKEEVTILEKALSGLKREQEKLIEENTVLKERLAAFENTDMSGSVAENLSYITGMDLKGEQENFEDRLGELFDQGIEKVKNNGKISTVNGVFFDSEGVQHNGKIILIGNVAALGVSDSVSGSLQKKDGYYMLVSESKDDSIRDFASGKNLSAVPIYISGSNAEKNSMPEQSSLIDTANSGGPIAWIILILGVIAFIFVIERFIYLKKMSSDPDRIINDVTKNDMKLDITRKSGAFGPVASSILKNQDFSREALEEKAKETILKQIAGLDRFFQITGVIAVVSPLLGLLGTVTGMISTFEIITSFGTGDPKILSGGISEALITTKFGLAVAVPVLICHNLLSRWSERIADNLQRGALRLINLIKDGEKVD